MSLDLSNSAPTGYDAITPRMQPQPLAITKLIRNPDGSMRVAYVDARTGRELPNLNGYNVYQSQNYMDPNTLKSLDPLKDETPETPQTPTTNPSPTPQADYQPPTYIRGDPSQSPNPDSFAGRGQGNNFGYVNKPDWAPMANMIPGAIGMAAKAVNTGINANNAVAVRDARRSMGLDTTVGQSLRDTMRDNHGQVANVSLGNNNYSVGLEAMSPSGRTNLTPNEARQRAGYMNTEISETPKSVVKEDTKAFNADMKQQNIEIDDHQGMLSQAKSFFDSLFSDDDDLEAPEKSKVREAQIEENRNDTGIYSPAEGVQAYEPKSGGQYNEFPDAPSNSTRGETQRSYDGKSYSGQNKGLDSPSESGTRFGGSGLGSLSDRAERDIERGRGGLY